MKALIIGGHRHGEWVDVLDGVRAWVDIRTASTHVIRSVNMGVTDVATGEVKEAYVLHLAVHPDIVGPEEMQLVPRLLTSLAMNEFSRAHGEPQEIPKESELHVPNGSGG